MTRDDKRIIRYGIIGTGRIAKDFAADLQHVTGAELHSVCSRDLETAKGFASQHKVPACHASMEGFLSDPLLDAVYIATPNSLHLPQALACIRAGKPVIVEKPIAMSAAAAQIIADEATKHSVLVMEGMWIRFLPGIVHAKSMIQNDEIGEITDVTGNLAYAHAFDPDSRLFNKALGGGAMLDLGVYLLSLSLYLLGKPQIAWGSWRAAQSGVDIQAGFELNYINFNAEMGTSLSETGGNVFEISGTKSVLRIENPFIKGQDLRILRGRIRREPLGRPPVYKDLGFVQKLVKKLPLPGQHNLNFSYPGNGLQFQAAAFAELVRSGAKVSDISPLTDSILVLRMIESVLSDPPL
jgi:predicted dehydrogenase